MNEPKVIQAKVIDSNVMPDMAPMNPRTMIGNENRRIQELNRQINAMNERIKEKKKEIAMRKKRIKLYEQADALLNETTPERKDRQAFPNEGGSTLSK